jgi:hypothetical protein
MTRALGLLLLLGACASPAYDSYSLGHGIATYDELRRRTEVCQARGGAIKPSGQGDPYQLSNYTCVIPRGS